VLCLNALGWLTIGPLIRGVMGMKPTCVNVISLKEKEPFIEAILPTDDPNLFKEIGCLVDGNFTSDGWFCGKYFLYCYASISRVGKEDDPPGGFVPHPSRLRLCHHRPQVVWNSLGVVM